MNRLLLIITLFFVCFELKAQSLYFPPSDNDNWETLSPDSLNWCTENIDDLLNYLEEKNSKAFIILKDGKIVIEKYFGTFTKDSVWYWASAGKSLTSFMVGIAQQENYLSVSDKTSDYLGNGWSNCTLEQENNITIWNQLTMTTGLDDQVQNSYCTYDSCLIYLADAGTRWAYHNAPYTLLDEVIEKSTGKSLNLYITQKLKNITGITGIFVPTGDNNVFYSKPISMARFGLLMLNKGKWNGNPVLTDTVYYNQMINSSQELNPSYGYLWWLNGKSSFMLPGLQYVFSGSLIPNAPTDMFSALGKNGQIIQIIPSENLVVVRIGDNPGEDELAVTFINLLWEKINNLDCTITSITQEVKTEVNIYPNPAEDFCRVLFPNQNFDAFVYNSSGKLEIQATNCKNSYNLNLQHLTNGIYHIRIVTKNNKSTTKKIIINRK